MGVSETTTYIYIYIYIYMCLCVLSLGVLFRLIPWNASGTNHNFGGSSYFDTYPRPPQNLVCPFECVEGPKGSIPIAQCTWQSQCWFCPNCHSNGLRAGSQRIVQVGFREVPEIFPMGIRMARLFFSCYPFWIGFKGKPKGHHTLLLFAKFTLLISIELTDMFFSVFPEDGEAYHGSVRSMLLLLPVHL